MRAPARGGRGGFGGRGGEWASGEVGRRSDGRESMHARSTACPVFWMYSMTIVARLELPPVSDALPSTAHLVCVQAAAVEAVGALEAVAASTGRLRAHRTVSLGSTAAAAVLRWRRQRRQAALALLRLHHRAVSHTVLAYLIAVLRALTLLQRWWRLASTCTPARARWCASSPTAWCVASRGPSSSEASY